VNSPQRLWQRHGKLEQPYGLPSPRLRDGTDVDTTWRAFVEVMGVRVGRRQDTDPGPAPAVPAGSTLRTVLAEMVRTTAAATGLDLSSYTEEQLLDLQQYNLFPNATVLVFPDLLQVISARPGATPDDSTMHTFVFDRHPAGDDTSHARAVVLTLPPEKADFGLVLNQDTRNLQRAQRGLHQPGFTHLTLSGEECRIINLHRNLEHYLGVDPSEITGG
jgi:hypothetical protein